MQYSKAPPMQFEEANYVNKAQNGYQRKTTNVRTTRTNKDHSHKVKVTKGSGIKTKVIKVKVAGETPRISEIGVQIHKSLPEGGNSQQWRDGPSHEQTTLSWKVFLRKFCRIKDGQMLKFAPCLRQASILPLSRNLKYK